MNRSIVTSMVLSGLLVGAACKKSNDNAASQPAKTAEPGANTANKEPAPAGTSAAASGDIGVTAGGIERAPDEGAAAMIASATGTVEVRRLGETSWTAAKGDTKLYGGDVVRTQDQSSATIMLADQSTIEVAEASSIAIASREGSADPASSAAVLTGLARFTVSARAPGEGAFRVYAPSAVVIAPSAATFGIGIGATGETRVGTEAGTLHAIGVAAMDGEPAKLDKSMQVIIAADGKLGAPSAWTTDDWGAWRDGVDAKADVGGTIKTHGDALAELDMALSAGYGELQTNADAAATFEASAATAAEKNDAAAYTASLPEGSATIDASFALAGRLEALTWAYAGHSMLATELYVRHPEAQAQWDIVAPRVDASVLWPKKFEVTATAFFQPLRTQYYVHHPVGRMHATLVGIEVPQFYAAVQPPAIEPTMVRAKLKGQIWMAPQVAYNASASARPVWIGMPQADWAAKAKVNVAAPRAKAAWYVRPATLTSTAFVGAPLKAQWQSKLTVGTPSPRAALAASWKIPVGMKVKVGAPNFDAAAKARASWKPGAMAVTAPKVDAKGAVDAKANAAMDIKGKATGKLDVKAPAVAVPSVDVKAKAGVATGAAANAAADAKGKVDTAVKASATIKAPEVKPPSVKVDAKVKASGGIKLGN